MPVYSLQEMSMSPAKGSNRSAFPAAPGYSDSGTTVPENT